MFFVCIFVDIALDLQRMQQVRAGFEFFAGFVWSFGFVVRVLWSLRFETSKWVLGILNGLLPLGWLEFRVC